MPRRGCKRLRISLLTCLLLLIGLPSTAVAEPAMTAKLFRLKHQTSNDVVKPLQALRSGAKGSKLDETSAFESISVFDYPANVNAIADAIRQLDTPTPDLVLHVHVLLAGNEGESDVPRGLDTVIQELSRTLKFRSYQALIAVDQRVRSGSWTRSEGDALLPASLVDDGSASQYEIKLQASVSKVAGKPTEIVLRSVSLDVRHKQAGRIDIDTDLTLRLGETAVVGTATLKNRAIVLVISGELK